MTTQRLIPNINKLNPAQKSYLQKKNARQAIANAIASPDLSKPWSPSFITTKMQQDLAAGASSAVMNVTSTPAGSQSRRTTRSGRVRMRADQARAIVMNAAGVTSSGSSGTPIRNAQMALEACVATHRFGYGPKPTDFAAIQTAGGARNWLLGQLNLNSLAL